MNGTNKRNSSVRIPLRSGSVLLLRRLPKTHRMSDERKAALALVQSLIESCGGAVPSAELLKAMPATVDRYSTLRFIEYALALGWLEQQ